MPKSRAVGVIGLTLLFAIITTALFLAPSAAPYSFLSYVLIFLLSDHLDENEIPIIFGFLVLLVGVYFVRGAESAAERMMLGLQAAGILTLHFGGLGTFRRGLNRSRYRMQVEMTEVDQLMRERERDMRFYEKYKENLDNQVRIRQDFSEAAHALSGTMELTEIRGTLLKILSRNFPEAHIELLSGVPKDPLESWAAQQRLPVLVPDIKNDSRFRTFHMSYPFRTIMVVPLHALHQPVGFLRIEHEKPKAFAQSDLRTADLYATLASLSMENVRLYEQIQEMAVRDGLTRLYTHRHFQQRLADEILQAGRSRAPVSVVLCDIDYFKKYNDTYGHQSGDELLITIAQTLTASVREIDYVARYGGEEFVLVLPALAKAEAVQVAEALRRAVEAKEFVFNGKPTKVTISLGVSSFPEDAPTQSQLIRAADERLYRSKHGGRNRVTSQ